jgi:hypothetical protein
LKIKQKARRSLQNYNGQNVRKSDLDQQGHCICSPIPFEHTLLALAVMLFKSLESRSAPMTHIVVRIGVSHRDDLSYRY